MATGYHLSDLYIVLSNDWLANRTHAVQFFANPKILATESQDETISISAHTKWGQEFPIADHQRSDTSRERGRPRHGRSILYVNANPLEPASGRQGTDGTLNSLKFFLNFTASKLLNFNVSEDS